MTDDELYSLAVSFKPVSEKDRVKRTTDTINAIFQLQEFRDIINEALAKLESGDVLSELDADPILNMNVPSVSSLIRPHCVERHWKIRNDEANKILKNDEHRKANAAATWRRKPYKAHKRLEAAKAFKQVFVTKGQDPLHSWRTHQEIPSAAWYRYFQGVYRTLPDTEKETP